MKKCFKCNLNRPLLEFYRRKTGSRAGEYYEKCGECYRVRGKTYYHLNRDRQLKLALLRKHRYKNERRKFIEDFKNGKSCIDCKKKYPPWVMEFDHREGERKTDSISIMVTTNTSNFEKIKNEIAKCDLVCSNCHRERTHTRLIKRKNAEVANVVKAPL